VTAKDRKSAKRVGANACRLSGWVAEVGPPCPDDGDRLLNKKVEPHYRARNSETFAAFAIFVLVVYLAVATCGLVGTLNVCQLSVGRCCSTPGFDQSQTPSGKMRLSLASSSLVNVIA
jgi:hypothetical protein